MTVYRVYFLRDPDSNELTFCDYPDMETAAEIVTRYHAPVLKEVESDQVTETATKT